MDVLRRVLASSRYIVLVAVLFLREAVAWDGSRDLLAYGAAMALVIASLTLFLTKKWIGKE